MGYFRTEDVSRVTVSVHRHVVRTMTIPGQYHVSVTRKFYTLTCYEKFFAFDLSSWRSGKSWLESRPHASSSDDESLAKTENNRHERKETSPNNTELLVVSVAH